MNVYDFDGTVYDGDSTVDFYLFCLRRHPGVLRALPRQAASVLSYKLGRCSKTEMKQGFYAFLRYMRDADEEAQRFWFIYINKVKAFYRKQREETDVIASASPEFLLAPACRMLGVEKLVASKVDSRTGACLGENCRGEEKLRRFEGRFPGVVPDSFYSDSLVDAPMARIARKAYLVTGESISEWPEYAIGQA